jgi:uracil-DNA glycosylase
LFQSRAEIIITLGQQPLKWFLREFDKNFGNLLSVQDYGLTTEVKIESVNFKLIPLFHPRQLLKEKNIDTRVGLLHYDWIKTKAKKIKLV